MLVRSNLYLKQGKRLTPFVQSLNYFIQLQIGVLQLLVPWHNFPVGEIPTGSGLYIKILSC